MDMKAASRQIYKDNAKQSSKAENHTKERKKNAHSSFSYTGNIGTTIALHAFA